MSIKDLSESTPYTIVKSNWYKALPYAFRIVNKDGNAYVFNLPINPSNLTINTHFATNIIASLYGTVEEHSEQRYFDIVIAGTTGMAPKYNTIVADKDEKNANKAASNDKPKALSFMNKAIDKISQTFKVKETTGVIFGRLSGDTSNTIRSATGGFFERTANLAKNAVNQVKDIGNAFTKKEDKSSIHIENTGYAAFHKLYKFLLSHKKDILDEKNKKRFGNRQHPIQFLNYKDNNEYNVVIQNFQLTRSADDPMLYKYSISMRGYDLKTIGQLTLIQGDIKITELGLDNINNSSLKSILSNTTRNAKGALSSTVATLKGLGS